MKLLSSVCRWKFSTQGIRNPVLPVSFVNQIIFQRTIRHNATWEHKKTHYDILEVKATATPKEIRSAFIRLSKEYHPDKNPEDPLLHTKFAQINEAYSVLKARAKNKENVNRKTTGEQNYPDSVSGDYWGEDDYHDMEHYAYMSSREYFHYTKQKMREHTEKVHQLGNEKLKEKKYSYIGVISAVSIFISVLLFHNYLSFRRLQQSEERNQRKSAYFTALGNKIHEDRAQLRWKRKHYHNIDFSKTDKQSQEPSKTVVIPSDEKSVSSAQ